METLIPEMGRISEDLPHGESDRLRGWSAEIEDLASSSGAEIAAFFGTAEYFHLTRKEPAGRHLRASRAAYTNRESVFAGVHRSY